MAMDAKPTTADTKVTDDVQPASPATHLHQFLTDNNYALSIDALTEANPFLEGKGFVLTDRPLLVISVKQKENK